MCLLVGATFFRITVAILLHECHRNSSVSSHLNDVAVLWNRVEKRPENRQVKKPPESWKAAVETQVLSL